MSQSSESRQRPFYDVINKIREKICSKILKKKEHHWLHSLRIINLQVLSLIQFLLRFSLLPFLLSPSHIFFMYIVAFNYVFFWGPHEQLILIRFWGFLIYFWTLKKEVKGNKYVNQYFESIIASFWAQTTKIIMFKISQLRK